MKIYILLEVEEVHSIHKTCEGAEKRIDELIAAHKQAAFIVGEEPYLTRDDYRIIQGTLED